MGVTAVLVRGLGDAISLLLEEVFNRALSNWTTYRVLDAIRVPYRSSMTNPMPEMLMMYIRLYLPQVTKGLGNVGGSYATVRKPTCQT